MVLPQPLTCCLVLLYLVPRHSKVVTLLEQLYCRFNSIPGSLGGSKFRLYSACCFSYLAQPGLLFHHASVGPVQGIFYMLALLVKLNQGLYIVQFILLVRISLLLNLGHLDIISRTIVRLVVFQGPEMGRHVLCRRAHARADRVVMVDALSYVRFAVGVVGSGRELVRVPEQINVDGRYQDGLVLLHELQKLQVSGKRRWRQHISLVQRQDAVHEAVLAELSLRAVP